MSKHRNSSGTYARSSIDSEEETASHLKDLIWMGASLKDLSKFPATVKRDMASALLMAQKGGKAEHAKPLKGFGGAGIVELVEDNRGDAYRAVYTVKFATAVYVLHAFKKKSISGIETPQKEMDLIRARLKAAEHLHKMRPGELK